MSNQLTPERVINITWLSVALSFCWPLPSNSGRIKTFGYKLLQIISIISTSLLFMPLLYSIYLHLDDIVIISKSICVAAALSQCIIQNIICIINYDSIQYIIEEMVTNVKEAELYERKIFSKYIAKCKIYDRTMVCFYLTAVAFSTGPIVLSITFPSDAEYPFRIDYMPVKVILYMHQAILSWQCASHMCLSIFGALLLWYASARFECLAVELQKITNIHMLVVCYNKQIHLTRYAEKIIANFRFIALYAIAVSTLALTLCGIIIILNVPIFVKLQFAFSCLTVLVEVYVYAWPADYLMNMSISVSRSVYNIRWYDLTLEMQKNLLIVLACQKPVVFSVPCLLPELSLRYYCSYISNAFSIFTTLRIIVDTDL